jgi:hypothetical protein
MGGATTPPIFERGDNMLSEICADIKNYFTYKEDKHPGKYKVEGGVLVPSVAIPGDYYAVFGSRKNNGVHKSTDVLEDEGEFKGSVWAMSIPKDFLDLAEEIADWQKKYGGVDSEAQSPFYSESFGGYSYTKSAGSTSGTNNSAASTWQAVYAARLNRWRRLRLY